MAWSSYFNKYQQGNTGYESDSGGGSGISPVSRGTGSGPLGTTNDWTWQYGSPHDEQQRRDAAANRSSSSRGGYAGSSGGSKSSTTVQRLRFTEERPEMPDTPELKMPEVDKRRIRALTQQAAAPAVRQLREGLQGAMNVHTDNPNVRRMTIREALQGYGTGLEKAMSGAGAQARGEHQQELNLKKEEAMANFKASYEKIMADYNNRWQAYLQSAEKVTETNSMEGQSGGFPTVVRRNVWGTPEIGPTFQVGYNLARGRDPMYGVRR